jgi:hypothetical protein
MNAKRCKRIRRALQGLPAAPFEMEYTTVLVPTPVVTSSDLVERAIPLTFKYPKDSYQRVYRDVKRYA